MFIRTFTGRSMQEALEKVRAKLGEKALIIETRAVKEPGVFGKKNGYEVIAAIDSPQTAQNNDLSERLKPIMHDINPWKPIDTAALEHVQTTETPTQQYTQAAAAKRNLYDRHATQHSVPDHDDIYDTYTAHSSTAHSSTHDEETAATIRHVRNREARAQTEADAHAAQAAILSAAAEQAQSLQSQNTDFMSHELSSIRRQLARLASGQQHNASDHIGEHLSQWLHNKEVPEEMIAEIDDIVAQAGNRLPADRKIEFIKRYLYKTVSCPGNLDWNECKNILVVGPTGVGKTTSIAKIAGDLVLNKKKRIALITIDTYRVGAADQLRAYADLLDVPFEIAQTPAQLKKHLERLSDYDHVLIDSAGRSPSDSTKVLELRAFCRAAINTQVMLAISSGAGRAEFASVIERFSILPLEFGVITKMDELQSPGRLLGCLRRHHIPIHFLTDGQEVPEDIRLATAKNFVDPIFEDFDPTVAYGDADPADAEHTAVFNSALLEIAEHDKLQNERAAAQATSVTPSTPIACAS